MLIEKVHLTLRMMKNLSPGQAKRYSDTEVVGLQVWVGAKTISYFLRKRKDGKEYTVKIGNWPDITLEEARQRALDKLGALANHNDINAPSGRKEPIVKDAFDYYYSIQETDTARKAAKCKLRHFLRYSNKRISDITLEDIEAVHKSLANTPTCANHAVKIFVSALHHLCKKLKKPYSNPATGLKMYELHPRKRYICNDEVNQFFESIEYVKQNTIYGMVADALLMCLYTGARKTNVCDMMLEEIDRNYLWTIPKEKYKTRKEHSIQLGKYEAEIVERYRNGRKMGRVFSGRWKTINYIINHVMGIVCEHAGMKDFHIHDLRRTLGTWMLSNGVPIAIVSKKLGHSSIAITEQVYAHITPEASKNATDETIDAIRRLKK